MRWCGDGLSQLGLGSAVVGRRVEVEAQRGLLGDLEARVLEIEATQLGVLEARFSPSWRPRTSCRAQIAAKSGRPSSSSVMSSW